MSFYPMPLGHHSVPSWAPCAIEQLPTSYFTHGGVYIYHCSSPNLSHPPLLPLCPHVHSLCLCLYSCPANRFICTIFSRFYESESESEVAQLYPTLCDPVDCSLPGSSICGALQARILEWVAISFSRGSSRPRDRTQVSLIAGRRFTLWATRALIYNICFSLSDLLHSVWQTLHLPTSTVVAQSLSLIWLFATPWTAACQASLSFTIFQSLLKLMSIKLMPSNHLILCRLLLLLPSVFPSIRVFSSESALCIRWPKYWSFSFSISLSIEYSGLISFRIDWWAIIFVLIFELRECVKNPASDWRASACAGIEPLVLSTSSSAQGDKWHRA